MVGMLRSELGQGKDVMLLQLLLVVLVLVVLMLLLVRRGSPTRLEAHVAAI